ncbi:MAG: hypothetical protein L3J18_13155 [Candidatus Brocadia sp.]|nr:MAG: hypothetical protein L3J18_13155 [Candidatus Brocadia sp.]
MHRGFDFRFSQWITPLIALFTYNVRLQPTTAQRRAERWTPQAASSAANRRTPQT